MNTKKTRNGGQWTEARFRSFIKSALRGASNRWGPKYLCKREARTSRNTYTCALCRKSFPSKSMHVDHIKPVVDPVAGFMGWDHYVARLFVEKEGYQLLCDDCHSSKTKAERFERKQHQNQ